MFFGVGLIKCNQPRKKIVNDDIESIISEDLPWDNLSGCSVVITGASGFIGGYLARTLLALSLVGKVENPIKVIGVVRNLKKAMAKLEDLSEFSNLELVESDLAEPYNLDVKANWFIHAASLKYYGIDPAGTLAPNVIGSYRLLQCAQNCQATGFLFVSSSEVYGCVGDRTNLSETDIGVVDPISLRSCYAESKRMGENMCISWMHQFGLPVYIVRPFHTYGPLLELDDGRVFLLILLSTS